MTYHAHTNITTADVVVPKGAGLLSLAFTNTKHAAFMLHSCYKQVFTTEFVRSLRPFQVLRFMDWLFTNANPGFYGDAGHHALH